MPSELKPCPFCGGEAEFHTDPGPTGECYGWVGCNQCDAMSTHCDIRSLQPEELHPIDAWNARTDADRIEALQAEVARLREHLRAALPSVVWQSTVSADSDVRAITKRRANQIRAALKGTDNE